MDSQELTRTIKEKAHQLGFNLAGVTSCDPPPHLDVFQDWIEKGYQASMDWLASERSVTRRSNPNLILEDCKSILVLGAAYPPPQGNLKAVTFPPTP